jgi:hypothetical protein
MSRDVIPITFEVPAHPEPEEMVRAWARGLRGICARSGENHPVPTTLRGITAILVFAPKGVEEQYLRGLDTLVRVNLWCIRASRRRILGHGPYAPLYKIICYQPEPPGQEIWQSIEALYMRRWGDCEDLACARVAERLAVGDPCKVKLSRAESGGKILYHVVVKNPDGEIEDPSRMLGMTFGREDDSTSPRCGQKIIEGEGA